MTISDWAGIGNLVLAAIAIAISLYVFIKQSQSEMATSNVLAQSRDSLRHTTSLLTDEQNRLNQVTKNLATADASLVNLEKHAADEATSLEAADSALARMVNVANAENAARLAALNAAPRIEISLESRGNGLMSYFIPRSYESGSVPTVRAIAKNGYNVFRVHLRNDGTAVAPSPIVIITSPDLNFVTGGGCQSLTGGHLAQCAIGLPLYTGSDQSDDFSAAIPPSSGYHVISVNVRTAGPTGRELRFSQDFRFYLALPT